MLRGDCHESETNPLDMPLGERDGNFFTPGYSKRGRKLRKPAQECYAYYGEANFHPDAITSPKKERDSSILQWHFGGSIKADAYETNTRDTSARYTRKRKALIGDKKSKFARAAESHGNVALQRHERQSRLSRASTRKKEKVPKTSACAETNPEPVYSCAHCLMTYKRKSSLEYHNKKIHKRNLKVCSKCCLSFDTDEELQVHFHSHYGNTFKCVMCDYCNSMWHKVQLHMQIHNDSHKYSCDMCPMRFASSSSLYSHKRFFHLGGSNLCDQCGFSAPSKYLLVQHKMSEHGHNFACNVCNFKCDNQLDLDDHTEKRHLRRLSCKYCPPESEEGKFATKELLFAHMKAVHPNDKCFVCDQCNYVAKLRHHLRKHSNMHTGVRPYKCTREGCDFSTKDHRNLKQHLVTKHCKPGELVCRQCRFVTTSQNEWDVHRAMHHMKIYRCAQCDFTSSFSASVRRHRLAKHISNDKMRFRCRDCSYVTNFREALVKHCLTHAIKETHFKCIICSLDLPERLAMHEHLQLEHPQENVHLCPSCPYMTKRAPTMRIHLATHSSVKPFSCSHCDYKGRTMILLKSHVAHKHPEAVNSLPRAPPKRCSRSKINGMPSLPSSGKPVTLTITTPKRRLLASAAQCDSDAARRPVMNSPLPEGSMRANDPSNELSGSDVAASTMTTPIVVAASDAIKAQLSSVNTPEPQDSEAAAVLLSPTAAYAQIPEYGDGGSVYLPARVCPACVTAESQSQQTSATLAELQMSTHFMPVESTEGSARMIVQSLPVLQPEGL